MNRQPCSGLLRQRMRLRERDGMRRSLKETGEPVWCCIVWSNKDPSIWVQTGKRNNLPKHWNRREKIYPVPAVPTQGKGVHPHRQWIWEWRDKSLQLSCITSCKQVYLKRASKVHDPLKGGAVQCPLCLSGQLTGTIFGQQIQATRKMFWYRSFKMMKTKLQHPLGETHEICWVFSGYKPLLSCCRITTEHNDLGVGPGNSRELAR